MHIRVDGIFDGGASIATEYVVPNHFYTLNPISPLVFSPLGELEFFDNMFSPIKLSIFNIFVVKMPRNAYQMSQDLVVTFFGKFAITLTFENCFQSQTRKDGGEIFSNNNKITTKTRVLCQEKLYNKFCDI